MAINKIVTDNVGNITTYHRIYGVDQNFTTDKTFIKMAHYTAVEYRDQEKSTGSDLSLASKMDMLTIPGLQEGITRGQLYTMIMAMPEWDGSTEI